MANDPAFLFYPGDYLRDTQNLSERPQAAYDRIMCEHMRNICITQAQLNFFTKRLTADEKTELHMVLSKVSGGFQISWVAESIEKRREYSDSRRKNRAGKKQKISSTYVPHMENEIVIENEDVNKTEFENYKKWTDQIIDNNDQYFESMFMNEHLKMTPESFIHWTRDHLGLLARYPKMRPPDQHRFRESCLKHIRENYKKPITVNGTNKNSNLEHIAGLAEARRNAKTR